MSYTQIFRRLGRLLRSQVNDVLDGLTPEERELHEFDAELEDTGEEEAQSAGRASGRAGAHSGNSRSGHKEGRHKPGEKDDAYYYAVLGLTPDASVEQIRKAYRKLIAINHPDRVATESPEVQERAEEKAAEINEAYHIIERRRGFN